MKNYVLIISIFIILSSSPSFAGLNSMCDDPDIYTTEDNYLSTFSEMFTAEVGQVYIETTSSLSTKPAYIILGVAGIIPSCVTTMTPGIPSFSPNVPNSGYYASVAATYPGTTHTLNVGARWGSLTPSFPSSPVCAVGTYANVNHVYALKKIITSADCPEPTVPEEETPEIIADIPSALVGLITPEQFNKSMGIAGIASAFIIWLFFAIAM